MEHRHEVEKTLKRFLKHKISYSFGLLVGFLIGGRVGAASATPLHDSFDSASLLDKIGQQKSEIEGLLAENEARILEADRHYLQLLAMGDWYSKPWYPSYFGSLQTNWTHADNLAKRWIYSTRVDTTWDGRRRDYNDGGGNWPGTGWIIGNDSWNDATVIYDNEARLTLIPELQLPDIFTPASRDVNFVTPAMAAVATPAAVTAPAPVSVAVSVTPATPTLPTTAVPVAPVVSVTIPDPQMSVTVGEIGATVPAGAQGAIFTPNIPTFDITQAMAPTIEEVVPTLPSAPTVVAPSWTPYVSQRSNALTRGNPSMTWLSANYARQYSAHNLFDGSPAYSYGNSGGWTLLSYVHSGIRAPLFDTITGGDGGKYVLINKNITSTGRTVTLYDDATATTLTTAGGGTLQGWNNAAGHLFNRTGGIYTGFTDPVNTATDYMAGYSPTAAELAFNGTYHAFPDNSAVSQNHQAIFELNPSNSTRTWSNIEAHLGGAGYLLSISENASNATLRMLNSEIHLYGEALLAWAMPGTLEFDFTGSTINIYDGYNTLFYFDDKDSGWAYLSKNKQGKIVFTNDIDVDKSYTVLLYLRNTRYVDRMYYLYGSHTSIGVYPYYTYMQSPMGLNFSNTGIVNMLGSANAAIRISDAVTKARESGASPMVNELDLNISFAGDQNVGIYFGSSDSNPAANAIFIGDIKGTFEFGNMLRLSGAQVQTADGNIAVRPDGTAGDTLRAENSVGIIVDSGQRREINVRALYPGTENYTNWYNPPNTDSYVGAYAGGFMSLSYTTGMQNVFDGTGNIRTDALIDDLYLGSDFHVTFGKYAKDNIAIVSRNGSVVHWSGDASDHAPMVSGVDETSTAVGSTIAFAEGIFFNPRQRGIPVASYIWNGIDYGLTRQGGKYYIPDYRSTVDITVDSTVNSIKSVPFYAKDGGLIKTKSMTLNGFGSTGAIAYAEKAKATVKTGTETLQDKDGMAIYNGNAGHSGTGLTSAGVHWSSEDAYYGPTITDYAGNVISHSSTLPITQVLVDGNIKAQVQGPRRDSLGAILPGSDKVNDNIGIVARVDNGTNGAEVTVSGNVLVNGIAAIASGTGALADIRGTASDVKTGENGALIAMNAGKIKFGGGTIEHKDSYAGSHADKPVFYAQAGSNIDFAGTTTINMYDGVAFFGASADYTAGAGATRYTNMSNVTVHLRDNGVNLGVFEDFGPIAWNGSTGYLATLRAYPKVALIDDHGFWYKSALEDAAMSVQIDVDRDNISQGSTVGDKFNDITMQKSVITIENGVTVTSREGNTLAVGATDEANFNKGGGGNMETGYVIKGTVDISDTTTATAKAAATFVDYGRINISTTGKIIAGNGVGAYGVNGSRIENNGEIILTGEGQAIVGLARRIKTDGSGNVDTPEHFGTDGSTDMIPQPDTTTLLVDIVQNGTITLTKDNSVAIYADNNVAGALRNRVMVTGTPLITVKDNSAGIVVKGASDGGTNAALTGEGGIISINTGGYSTPDITVGKNSIGIYAENSTLNVDVIFQLEIKDNSIGVYMPGNSTFSGNTIYLDYRGGNTGSGAGILLDGTGGSSLTNNFTFEITDYTGTSGTVSGVYARSLGPLTDTLNNWSSFTLTGKGATAIYSKDVSVNNSGTIQIGTTGNPGGKGIYLEDAALSTDGNLLKVDGTGAMGVYAKSTSAANPRDLDINAGSSPMVINGATGVGVYVDDTADIYTLKNASDITLSNSAAEADRKTGLVVAGSSQNNFNSARILVGKNNTGVILKNATFINTSSGNIDATHNEAGTQSIGIHAEATGGSFRLTNQGIILAGGVRNIGVSLATGTGGSGLLDITAGFLNITAGSLADGDIVAGVYGKGNNLTVNAANGVFSTLGANTIGVYLDGDNTSVLNGALQFDLSSVAAGKSGIGAYFKNGAHSTGAIQVNSTATAVNGAGQPVRPVGLYYGPGSTANTSNIEIISGSQEAVGLYAAAGGNFTNSGNIDVNAKGIGAVFSGTNTSNNGNVTVNAADGVGLYFDGGQSTSTAAAQIQANGARSMGVAVRGAGASYENKGTIASNASDSIGLVALGGGIAKNSGTLTIQGGYGGAATGAASLLELTAGSLIRELTTSGKWAVGAIGLQSGTVALHGGNIQMGDDSIGILLQGGSGELRSGNITAGIEGIGVLADGASLDMAGYNGTFALGDRGIGIYSKNSAISGSGVINVNYSGTNKGIGIWYDGTAGTAVTNGVSVNVSGSNFVNIYSKTIDLTNTADQKAGQDGIAIGADGGSVSNSGTLDLDGPNSAGIWLDGAAVLKNPGSVTGAAVTTGAKTGIFVNNGDIQGNQDFTFGISGGVGIYLKNQAVNWSGTLHLTGASVSPTLRSIGIYAGPAISGSLDAGIDVTGADALGLYIAEDPGVSAADILYTGDLSITGSSGTAMGIGAYIAPNAKLTLGTGSSVTIGGTNNIGFYVDAGGDLQIGGAGVTNTPAGIFAYLNNGTLSFTAGSVPAVNYMNVIVDGSAGSVTNATTITVGTTGLQGLGGATITNTATGVIQGSVEAAMGMTGSGAGTTLTNSGKINLSGKKSVGLYAGAGVGGTSSGDVTAGPEGVAIYADAGGSLAVSGKAEAGEGGAILYAAGGTIQYTGPDLTAGKGVAAVIATDSASNVDLNGANIAIGEKGTGIYVTGTATLANVTNPGSIAIGKSGAGIYLDTAAGGAIGNNMTAAGESAVGIYTAQNGNITYTGNMNGSGAGAVGIFSEGTGQITNGGNIRLTGQSAAGIYAENAGAITNNTGSVIEIGNGTQAQPGVAIYGKRAAAISNPGDLKTGDYGVGIYNEGGNVTSSGSITGGSGATGIFAKNATIANSGPITTGSAGNGIYALNGSVSNSANISTGDGGAGIYGDGTAGVNHTAGTVSVGDNGVGIATQSGNIQVAAGTAVSAGERSTHLWSDSGSIRNDSDLTLAKYSVGIYTRSGSAENYGDIVVGESDVDSTPQKISLGMGTDSGTIKNYGTITLPYDNSVGMLAKAGGTAENHGTVDIQGNDSIGIEALRSARALNYGNIKVSGAGSRGIAAMSDSVVENYGTIDVSGTKAQGIYVETGATVDNQGAVNVSGSGGTAITVGPSGLLINSGTMNLSGGAAGVSVGGEGTVKNIGDITIDGPQITIDGVTLDNIGRITVNGPLDFGTVKISGSGTNPYVGTISADTFEKGQFIALKEITQGSNKEVHIVQYLEGARNIPNNGEISAISESVSYVIDLQKDPHDSNKISIVLVKVPYVKMLEGTEAIEFGKGLDELFPNAVGTELQMFDALDAITEDDQLASTFETELRGNMYANIQNRMEDIREVFDASTEQLRHDRLYSKESLKVGVLGTGGEFKDRNPAVENYKSKTLGFNLLKEYEHRRYGRKTNWNFGFGYTQFEFEPGSKERVYSLQGGIGYEDFVGGSKRLKYHGRLELTANRHNALRKMSLTDGTYTNKGNYWSWSAIMKNKLRYEFPQSKNGKVKAGVFASFNAGYGRFEDFSESGDGLRLKIKGEDLFTARPGVGADVTLTHYTKQGKISLSGKVSAEYELGKFYDGPNKAKFKGTTTDYYKLEQPKDLKGIVRVGAQLKYETKAGHAVGLEVVREEGTRRSTRVGVNFTYRFGL